MEPLFYHVLNLAVQSDYSKLKKLKSRFKTWQLAWEKTVSDNTKLNPEKEWEKLDQLNIRLVLLEDRSFPSLLREIPWSPFGIYILGSLRKDENVCVAIVGTRKASENGRELAKQFGRELAKFGLNVASGLALGIDAAAHSGALEANGYTLAILGNGLNEIYPKTNEKLGKKILESGGAIISEYPPGMPSLPHHFLQRNRIISGFSKGILIIEAPETSGSLATARFAIDQNREVFVIPGPITHPNFKGSNELIRQGATLVTKPEHILEILKPELLTEEKPARSLFSSTPFETAILKALSESAGTLPIDKIIELTKLDAEVVNRALSFLTIKNAVKETDRGYSL